MKNPTLSIVVPCYNEEACLPELHARLTKAAASVADDYEIVLVNDGSRDRTWDMMRELSERDPHVVAIPGTRRVSQLEENAAAGDIELDAAELAILDAASAAFHAAGWLRSAISLLSR